MKGQVLCNAPHTKQGTGLGVKSRGRGRGQKNKIAVILIFVAGDQIPPKTLDMPNKNFWVFFIASRGCYTVHASKWGILSVWDYA